MLNRLWFMKKTYLLAGHAAQAAEKLKKGRRIWALLGVLAHFSAAALLARGSLFGAGAPFAVSFTAASSRAGGGYAAALGSFFGYLVLRGDGGGLKYAAAALLTVTCSQVFSTAKIRQGKWFMPAAAAGSIAATGLIFVITGTGSLYEILLYLCEIAVTLGTSYFYQLALEQRGEEKRMLQLGGTMVLLATMLVSLYDIKVWEMLSPSRIIAILLIMTVGYLGGYAPGAAMGVAMGVTMDAAGGESTFFTCVYGFSGLLSGVFNRSGRTVFVCSYVIAGATASLLGVLNPLYLPGLYESFISSVLFVLIPESMLQRLKAIFVQETPKTADYVEKVRRTARHYANETAQAFFEMYTALSQGLQQARVHNDEDVAAIFDRAADKVCAHCAIRNVCWEKEYISTLNALNDVSVPMMREGRAKAELFPRHFASRCVKFPDFLTAVNDALGALLARRQYKERIAENRGLIAQQYAGITGILRQVGGFMSEGPEFLPGKESQLLKYAEAFGQIAHVAAFKDRRGRLRLELSGDGISEILKQKEGFTAGLGALMGVKLTLPEQICDEMGSRIYLTEREPYSALVGVGVRQKRGQEVCGDSGNYFISDDGKACLLLSDGMGTGKEAGMDSYAAVKLIERFLRAGIGAEETLKTVGPALRLRTCGESFVTIDIGTVDLFTGDAETVKCGSAPTYVVAPASEGGARVRRILCTSMPAGLSGPENQQDVTRFRLTDGALLVLVTDGVTDGSAGDDIWLTALLEEKWKLTPKELAAEIILAAAARGSTDDMTALVMRLQKRQ